jgi:DNA-binding CsgD family transcriptional regulator
LRLLLAERSTEDIAGVLHLSPKTVANTRYLIKSKLGVASDIELVLVALRQGILGAPWQDGGRERPMD